MMKNLFICASISIVSSTVNAQIKIEGIIYQNNSQQKVSNARITFNNTIVSSSQDGFFSIPVLDSIGVISVSKDNFETQIINYNLKIQSRIDIRLNPIILKKVERDLDEVKITVNKKYKNKRENPAYRILNEIWKRDYKNAFNQYDNYSYEEYQKIEASLNNIDSTFSKKRIFKGLEFMFDEIDSTKSVVPIYLNEKLSKIYKRVQPIAKEKSILIAEKAAGFEDNQLLNQTIANLYRDFNIYDNSINFFNKGYTSPLSKSGFSVYNYDLLGDVFIDGENCYTIKYSPKNNDALLFRGMLYVSKEAYAVKKVTLMSAKNSDVNFVRNVDAELTYYIVDDKTFLPEKSTIRLDMSLFSKNENSKGIYLERTLSYKNFDFNKPEIDNEVDVKIDLVNKEAYSKDDQFWDSSRHEVLSEQNQKTYNNINRLWETPKFKNVVKFTEALESGYLNFGKAIDFGSLYSIYGENEVEGSRIRLGARTYFGRNDMWRLEGYGAYGFKDKKMKYGAEARWMLNKDYRFIIGVGSRQDVQQLGVQLMSGNGVMNRTFASSTVGSRGDNSFLSWLNENNVNVAVEPFRNFNVRLDATYQEITSANPNVFKINYIKNGFEKKQVNDARLALTLDYRPGANYSQYGVDRFQQFELLPTFSLVYTQAINGVFNSDFNYSKLQFSYKQPFLFGSIGRSVVNVELGKTFGEVPLSLMSVLPGNQSYGISKSTFSQLNYYEFVTDAYSTFMYDHHFDGWIFNKIPLLKKLKLREVVFFKGAWGSLTKDNVMMNRSNIIYNAPKDKIYYEYGFGIENIGFGNFRFLRVDFNWRGNYLENPEAQKFGVKFGLKFGF